MTCGRSNKKSSTSCSKKFSKGVLQIGRQCKIRRWTLPPLKAQAATCFLDKCRALILNSIHLHIGPDTHSIKDTTGHGKERGVTSKAPLRPFYRSVAHYCTSHVTSQSSSLPHHPASPHCAITCVHESYVRTNQVEAQQVGRCLLFLLDSEVHRAVAWLVLCPPWALTAEAVLIKQCPSIEDLRAPPRRRHMSI